MKDPRITVLMPVHNGEKYMQQAIDSILDQTFQDFEFIIINDRSTDRTREIITGYKDERIRLFNHEPEATLPDNLNKALSLARGDYIARMDCDDISHPKRFEKQIQFLDNNPDVGVCGTWIKRFGDIRTKNYKPACDDKIIKASLLFGCGVMNPTAMIRSSVLQSNNIRYNSQFFSPIILAEDWDFWYSASRYCKIINLPEVLLSYRVHKAGLTIQATEKKEESDRIYALINKRMLDDYGMNPSVHDLSIHRLVCSAEPIDSLSLLTECEHWLIAILEQNKSAGIYNKKALEKILSKQFIFVCKKASVLGLSSWNFYWKSPLSKISGFDFKNLIKFFVKCLLNR
jgi:glycosyltransferase involved in cell wall biosynthesis